MLLISNRGLNFNIPISIWLLDTHPEQAPKVYVCPTEDMEIRAGLHVDDTGKVYLPYLSDWRNGTSDLQVRIHCALRIMICKDTLEVAYNILNINL